MESFAYGLLGKFGDILAKVMGAEGGGRTKKLVGLTECATTCKFFAITSFKEIY